LDAAHRRRGELITVVRGLPATDLPPDRSARAGAGAATRSRWCTGSRAWQVGACLRARRSARNGGIRLRCKALNATATSNVSLAVCPSRGGGSFGHARLTATQPE